MLASPRLKAACLSGAYLISALVIIYIADIAVRHQTTSAPMTTMLIMAFAGIAGAQILSMFYLGNALDGRNQGFLTMFKTLSKIRKIGIIAVFMGVFSMFTTTMPETMLYVIPQSVETLFSVILIISMMIITLFILFFMVTTISSLVSSFRCKAG